MGYNWGVMSKGLCTIAYREPKPWNTRRELEEALAKACEQAGVSVDLETVLQEHTDGRYQKGGEVVFDINHGRGEFHKFRLYYGTPPEHMFGAYSDYSIAYEVGEFEVNIDRYESYHWLGHYRRYKVYNGFVLGVVNNDQRSVVRLILPGNSV